MFSAVFLILVYLRSFAVTEISNFSNNEFTDDEHGQYIKEEGISIEDNPNSIDVIPDVYPTYTAVPRTGFSCSGKLLWHYYADSKANCQVFHICETQHSKISFICPTGSIFNQRHLICDWFYNFDCSDAVGLYPLSNEFNEQELLDEVEKSSVQIGFDLAAAGEKLEPINETKIKNVPRKSQRRDAFLQNRKSDR